MISATNHDSRIRSEAKPRVHNRAALGYHSPVLHQDCTLHQTCYLGWIESNYDSL